ncbi:MAG TPA: SCO family protein [Candidatus Kryptonia bacterium]
MKRLLLFKILAAVVLTTAGATYLTNHSIRGSEKSRQSANTDSTTTKEMCCVEMGNSDNSSDSSIFQIDSKWKDQNGMPVRISDFRGKLSLIAMFYSHCTYACPLTINDLKLVEKAMPSDLAERVEFVLVSIDPARDNPSALRNLANQQLLLGTNWHLLTGRSFDIRTLAALLGVRYKKKSDGSFLHSSQIALLNEEGEIVFRHAGLTESVNDIVNAIESHSRVSGN